MSGWLEPSLNMCVSEVRVVNSKQQYLGDGVYARIDDCNRLVLETPRGISSQMDCIVFESDIWREVINYVRRNCDEKYQNERTS